MYSNELYHYGVKGMKWGVRRYQNPDGSLTSAGKSRYNKKTEKRINKLEKYRRKKAIKANKNAVKNHKWAHSEKQDIEDLKRKGTFSEVYKRALEAEREERAAKYENLTGKDASNRSFAETALDEIYYSVTSEQRLKDLINDKNNQYRSYKKAAKKWEAANKNLMNMTIDELTTKQEIKYVYKNKIKDPYKQPSLKGNPNSKSDMNAYAKRTMFMDEYKPTKGSKNTLRDIDDFELIDISIDDPSFRKEYGVSDSDYKKYKKMFG